MKIFGFGLRELMRMKSEHVLKRTRGERRSCNHCIPCGGSLSLGSLDDSPRCIQNEDR